MSFQLRHCLLEQLTIQIKTDRYNVAALRRAQNAACAANLQIAHGDAKTRAQRAVLFDGADPFARGADCHHFKRKKQIGVCLVLGSTDPSAQLIQIREAKLIRSIDDDRVGIRNIEATFNDRGANKHVGFAGYESRHDRFQFVRVHLSMANFNSGLWAKMDNPVPHPLDCHYAIVQKEYLPLALQFTINRSANDALIVRRYHCFHWQAIERRSLNRGHIFYAHE